MRKRRTLPWLLILIVLLAAGAAAYWHWHGRQSPSPSSPPSIHYSAAPAPGAATTPARPWFNKHKYSTADPASPWVVVNKQHPINPTSYTPADLTPVGNGQQMRAEAAKALQRMFADAQAAGHKVVVDSGYRSYNDQTDIYTSMVQADGQAQADTLSARPGYSEHQTGWAADLGTEQCQVADCFGSSASGKWVAANAYKYGFLLRYPTNLTRITGYSNEAWHFRYVGPALAEELHKEKILTLEQFFGISGGTTYK